MGNFQKIVNGAPTGTAVQGTDIGSGSATIGQFLGADGAGNSAYQSAVTIPTAGRVAGWDVNANLSADNFLEGYATTATAGGTTTLTVGSTGQQYFTGTLTQTVVLPVASTLVTGMAFTITNNSTLAITVQSSGANIISTQQPTSTAVYTCILASGTTAASWSVAYLSGSNSVGFGISLPTVQTFLSGSGTYTTPNGVAYIEVEMVGGGGGGGGSGTGSLGSGGSGGSTTFGTSLLTATAGTGGLAIGTGGTGGTGTVNSPAVQIAAPVGGIGQAAQVFTSVTNSEPNGGSGASSPFGGAGGGALDAIGSAAASNSGSGGGGAGSPSAGVAGAGGGAGGYVKAIITNPIASYSYAVGVAGSAGAAGTSGFHGGAGGSGVIIVREYYSSNLLSGVTVTASSAPTKQIFLSGSGTYQTPSNVQYITVRMVGGGGGGSGSGQGTLGAGTTGNATTFGAASCGAGHGTAAGSGGNGGVASLGGLGVGIAIPGGAGGSTAQTATASNFLPGGTGGASAFGGGASGGFNSTTGGVVGAPGAGGGGGGIASAAVTTDSGSGGGAGAYIETIVANPASTYSYSVGTGGAGGTAGSGGGGAAGSAGFAGIIIVEEHYVALATGGFNGSGGANMPTVQSFLTGTGTYTTPANVLYIDVQVIGGGGGGQGSGTAALGSGGTGGTTTFGSVLSCVGGSGGSSSSVGGNGGTATFTSGSGTILVESVAGTPGGGGSASTSFVMGGVGGPSALGGGGKAGAGNQGGGNALGIGSGGGGSGTTTSGGNSGGGGGAGAYARVIITNPLSTYSYSVGTAGTLGTAGTNGGAGGSGSAGAVIVTEYYANGAVGTATGVTGSVASKQIQGVVDGSNAPTGFIGEYLTASPVSNVTPGSSGAFINVTSLTLTPGDWDVWGNLNVSTGSATSVTTFEGGLSTTSASSSGSLVGTFFESAPSSGFAAGVGFNTFLGMARVNVTVNTTIFLIGLIAYSTLGTMVYGTSNSIQARRVR